MNSCCTILEIVFYTHFSQTENIDLVFMYKNTDCHAHLMTNTYKNYNL